MEIVHVSAECYPVAKAGGLGDVVGALPKYQNKLGHIAKVVMPMYRTKFLMDNEWVVDFKGHSYIGNRFFEYTVIKERYNVLEFDLYLIDIPGLLDREKIYGYADDTERFVAFQIAIVDWLTHWQHQPDVVHVHDYHAGLIPFMMQHCYAYNRLGSIPSVLTIHNAQYQGWMGWDQSYMIPAWDSWKAGLLEWKNTINPLASAIKCAWKITTVSWSYLDELRASANGLEDLFEYERGKCAGILNGIDNEVWDPLTDTYISDNYSIENVHAGKHANKLQLCNQFNLDVEKPLIIFIGRLVGEKAADILPDSIMSALYGMPGAVNFLILGSGEPQVEWQLKNMVHQFQGQYNVMIGYNEKLSHQMYAGADFLLMPSRVEPCGLNQMYAMRYGTVPMVRATGGLKDTVIDMGDPGGYGIRFYHASVGDVFHGITRAVKAYEDSRQLGDMRARMMQVDNSWDKSAQDYVNLYQGLT
ncbi:glycogen synthase [Segetibacter sp. 3557_3]|uniref:glycogen synthase n=1 Tax=Segetibacter sp. 3557_3 TaxID=2547429 RepID=UPI0010590734|nr:glycogen synthase [Segetibacter sp. 3557_3]TDH26522.1 glycogen synthase [Segetibacter sp. 3557_3]